MTGCRAAQPPLPDLLSESLNALGGPVRVTWYLSPELSDSPELRSADRLMADLVSASDPEGPTVSAVVRAPEPGERQPGSLLPIPASDNLGNTVFLWSSLVLDWRDRRVVIPDIWEPGWLALDLARALQDLSSGGPLPLGYLNGDPDGPDIPLRLLTGRWNPGEWYPETSSPGYFDLLIIQDGPELEPLGPGLVAILDDYVDRGGGALVTADGSGASSAVAEWAKVRNSDKSPPDGSGRVIFTGSAEIFNPEYYRDLDTALLLAAGRIDLLAMMAADTGETGKAGTRPAGSRLLNSAEKNRPGYVIDPDKVSQIAFSDEGLDIFTLEKSEAGWFLVSGGWKLPARSDRVGSFLRRLQSGSGEIWKVTENAGLLSHDLFAVSTAEIQLNSGKKYSLDFAGIRPAGGGAYFLTEDSAALWPLINGGEIAGDARYWMERRLFPRTESVIRAELRTDSRLYWRLHEEGGVYILSDGDGSRLTFNSDSAADYLGRLLRAEAITVAPVEEEIQSPLKLVIEESNGRRIEYRLGDDSGGRVVAESEEGLLFLLDETLVSFILAGPVPDGSASD